MSKVQILDCTLRDGGYVNDFMFGKTNLKKIVYNLTEAGIDIIECGFLRSCDYDANRSIFNRVEAICDFIPQNRRKSLYVAMVQLGKMPLDEICNYDGRSVDGIRLSFHYNEVDAAIEYCMALKEKGYKVFMQPVGTSSYDDEQLLCLIKKVNQVEPYSFYLVDTLGLMDKNETLRFFYIIDHNLKKSINIGFHSHNNLQLSFSNCQALSGAESNRVISMDSSVYGMGRGAGNLNTELIANYLNEHHDTQYEIDTLLEIVDEFIIPIRHEHEWGYAVPYYLAAINGCHPNYASYYMGKQTLNVKSISNILRSIEPERRSLFDKDLAERKYLDFQSHEIDDSASIEKLKAVVNGRNVLVLAPGGSLSHYQSKIKECAERNDCIVISANFVPDFIECDYTFLTNLKRYKSTFNPNNKDINLICTSNVIVEDRDPILVNYSSLLNEDEIIMDNTALLLLNLLVKLNPQKVFLAGLDGFDVNGMNYYQKRLDLDKTRDQMIAVNNSISKRLQMHSWKNDLQFITPTLYTI